MRILLATDGSPQARGAEVLAEWLCYKLSAKLVALYVRDSRLIRVLELMDFGALTVPVPAYREELEKALSAHGEALLERIRKSAEEAGLQVEVFMETGLPHEVILRHARTGLHDLRCHLVKDLISGQLTPPEQTATRLLHRPGRAV